MTGNHFLFQLEVPTSFSSLIQVHALPNWGGEEETIPLKNQTGAERDLVVHIYGRKAGVPTSMCIRVAGWKGWPQLCSLSPVLRGKIRINWYFWLRHTRATWSLPDHQRKSEQAAQIQFPLVPLELWKARKNPRALHFISFPQHSHSLVQTLPSAWRTEVHLRIKILKFCPSCTC